MTSSDDAYRPPSGPEVPAPSPSLLKRVFEMPFSPSMWSQAAAWRTTALIAPLVVLALLMGSAVAVYRTWGLREELRRWGREYSEPAVVVENGAVRVEGDRVIRFSEGDSTLLVDPNETVPLSSVKTTEYIVVRRHEIIRHRPLGDQVTKVADVQQMIGVDPLRIDGPAILRFETLYGRTVQLVAVFFLLAFVLIGEMIVGAVSVSFAAAMAMAGRGNALLLPHRHAVRTATAAYSLVIVLGAVLNLIGAAPGGCVGVVLWPVLLAFLTTWRLGR